MCNAHNHPPGCSCGWGGVWYGSAGDDAGWLFRREPRPRRLGLQRGTISAMAGGFTNPNSRCPVCGVPVYYYESPYGGRVFFDSLGPPWPKHPCTSGATSPRAASNKGAWHTQSWHPVTSVTIEAEGTDAAIYRLSGRHQGRDFSAYFRAHEVVMAEIVRVRKTGAGAFDVSILDYDTVARCWYAWDGTLHVAGDRAKSGPSLAKTVVHSHATALAPQASSSLATAARSEQISCPDCAAKVNPKKLGKHLRLIHGYLPLGTLQKFTGRLIIPPTPGSENESG